MSAKCAIVCPDFGALSETCNGFANMYEYKQDKLKHAEIFSKYLLNTINKYNENNHIYQKEIIDDKHSWPDTIRYKWKNLLERIQINNNKIILTYD
jgi:alkyl sulfatase BDS1-like metallo-beta-lactamase superfamily hydrolase